jgi:hypothetical protein
MGRFVPNKEVDLDLSLGRRLLQEVKKEHQCDMSQRQMADGWRFYLHNLIYFCQR